MSIVEPNKSVSMLEIFAFTVKTWNRKLLTTVRLGNISINCQYYKLMMHNNQYRSFFEVEIILHVQYIAVYRNILQ